VAALRKEPCPVVRTRAGFHADSARRQRCHRWPLAQRRLLI
jgi:hypothetical protein